MESLNYSLQKTNCKGFDSKNRKNELEYLTELFFLRNAEFLFDERENVLDDLRGGIFSFETTDIHSDDLERPWSSKPPTTAPVTEDVLCTPQ